MIIPVEQFQDELRALGFENVYDPPYNAKVLCPSKAWLDEFASFVAGIVQPLLPAANNDGFNCQHLARIVLGEASKAMAESKSRPMDCGLAMGECSVGIGYPFKDGEVYLGSGQWGVHKINPVRCNNNEIYFLSGRSGQIEIAKDAVANGYVIVRGPGYSVRV